MESRKRPFNKGNNNRANALMFLHHHDFLPKELFKKPEENKITTPKSYVYYHKNLNNEIKKEQKNTTFIDSLSELRLPEGFIDLSYDNIIKNE